VNPRKHPFYVWKKAGQNDDSYQKSAEALGAVVFTNGPMMAGFSPDEIKKKLLKAFGFWGLIGLAGGALLGAIICALTAGVGCALWAVLMGIAVGGTAGIAGAGAKVISILEGGIPFNVIQGRHHGINDSGANVNGNLVWFGRKVPVDFSSFQVGRGVPVTGLVEMSAGLIPAVMNWVVMSDIPGKPNFNQAYANLKRAAGTSVWALIPLGATLPAGLNETIPPNDRVTPLSPEELSGVDLLMPGDTQKLDGVIFVIAKYSSIFNDTVGSLLQSIGTRDAVEMDGSDSVMLGSATESWVGTPVPAHKQHIQHYGFYCQ
jgi:hypothetical protein